MKWGFDANPENLDPVSCGYRCYRRVGLSKRYRGIFRLDRDWAVLSRGDHQSILLGLIQLFVYVK
jgi:hypothetical protein